MDTATAYTRRHVLWLGGAAGVAAFGSGCGSLASPPAADDLVARNDRAARELLARQVIDAASPWCGGVPDEHGLHGVGAAAGLVETLTCAYVHPRSSFHRAPELLARIGLVAAFLERAQDERGNIDLLTTNFGSPPDTAFVVHHVAGAAAIARRLGAGPIEQRLRPFLERAAQGMAAGGVHTPNHRWVLCAALAQVHALIPYARWVRRIDEWLAEGIDIDADGQFSERSTLVYAPITDRALVVMAEKLQRPELLEPVRRNLAALPWLLHADGELVTEISRRQDQHARGTVAAYWFPLAHLARRDRDGTLATLARMAAPGVQLAALLEYPDLESPLPSAAPLPEVFVRELPAAGLTRIRRGARSATILHAGSSRLLTLRSGAAVLEGLRMAAAFFGKGQFVPDGVSRTDGGWLLRQSLEAPYWQPLGEPVAPDAWLSARARRATSEVCRLEQSALITETDRGLRVRLRAEGTDGVPVAVELGFRAGGRLLGGTPVAGAPGVFLLASGVAEWHAAGDAIRFGPGAAPHAYVQIRGAEPRLPGVSVFFTGFTPFDRTIELECG